MAYSHYHQLRVLVIDDFKQFLDTLCSILGDFGVLSIDTVTNGNQALKLCAMNHYDLILCDYNLGYGKKTGLHILEILRKNSTLKNHAPFLLITAEVSKHMVMATYDYAPDAYLTKPFSGKALKQRLDKLLVQREAMIDIYRAEESNDLDVAVALCEKKITEGGRYSSICRNMLGELYVRQKNYDRAEQVYSKALEERALGWAKMGLAKVFKARGKMEQASECLKELIIDNPSLMQAYDLLAEVQQAMGDVDLSQATLQEAVGISPLSILRQQRLASVAKTNQDLGVAAEAFLRSVQLGTHSCYDQVEVHLDFGRTTAALLMEENTQVEDLPDKALKSLQVAAERFDFNADQEAQFLLVKSQVYQGLNDHARAETLLHQAEKVISEHSGDMDIDTQLDLVQSFAANGEKKRAENLLSELSQKFKSDEKALEKIDQFLEEPKSGVNRKRVAALNREGIGLYNQNAFKESVVCFERAQRMFPKHTGIHLNLVQSLLGEMQENGFDSKLMDLCLATLQKVRTKISSEHKNFARYKNLDEKAHKIPQIPKSN